MRKVWSVVAVLLTLTSARLHAVKIINNSNQTLFGFPRLWEFPEIHGDYRKRHGPAIVYFIFEPGVTLNIPDLESMKIAIKNGPQAPNGRIPTRTPGHCYLVNLQRYHTFEYKGDDPQECDITIDEANVSSHEKNPQTARIVTREEYEQHAENQEKRYKEYEESHKAFLSSLPSLGEDLTDSSDTDEDLS